MRCSLHVLQVMNGEEALPHHSAMLNNDSVPLHHNSSDIGQQHVSDQHLQGAMPESSNDAMPDSANDAGDSSELRDNVTNASRHPQWHSMQCNGDATAY